jgi:PAS domain S-box-containing protein
MQHARPDVVPAFLRGGGEMALLIAAFDWSSTSLGALASWPPYLRQATSLMLRSAVPMVMLWGDEGVMIYNDAYSVFAGGRHPQLLGSPVRSGWPEVAAFNDNVMRVGLAGGTLAYQDQELTLYRHGRPEQVWMNLDYSPVLDDQGEPAGVLAIVVETTAKVRAERRVAGESERLRAMFQQSPGFMAMYRGPHHVIEFVNPVYHQLIGGRDVIGKPFREALPEVEGQGYFELLDNVFHTGEPFLGAGMRAEVRRTPEGPLEELWVDFVYQPVRGDDGQVTGIFVQGTDVTQRVQAEKAARESEAKFRAFAQAMPNQVWVTDAKGWLEWVNDRVRDYLGATLEDLRTIGWADYLHPDDVAGAMGAWQKALANGHPFEMEFRLRRHDGRYRWHLSRAVPIKAEDGAVAYWIGANTDIADQRDAADALAQLNANLELEVAQRTADRDRMWKLATDAMVTMGTEGRLLAANPACRNLLGRSELELAGSPLADLVHPEDASKAQAALQRLAAGEQAQRFESRVRRADGGYAVLAWIAVRDQDRIHAVGRDVTADREAAERLRESQAMLQQAQKMDAIGKLTGGVAHDFNNLLQVIGGNLQLLSKLVVGNEQAVRHVGTALSGVNRGAKLASQLLAFARRQPLEPRVVNVGRFVSGMEDMLRRSLGDSVELETIISGGLWNTFVDPVQVENALLNLAINARDAMDAAGKLTIEVGNSVLDDAYAAAHPEVTAGQYVMIAVSDTGCGMPPEIAAKVFEPFFSTKPEGKGTGLGLSMVYGFVKQSGGHVKIYSEVGHGTTVKLYLPRSLQVEDALEPLHTKPVEGGSETILVAEDDDEVRGTVVAMLESLGYKVLKARDADSALAVIQSGARVDLLFTDVVMPGKLRSPELARRARELLPQLAVLFTSGYTENAIVHGGRLDPGVELLGKPYTQEALGRKIRHVLANQQQRAVSLSSPKPLRPVTLPNRHTVLLVEDDEIIRTTTAELVRGLGHEVKEAAAAAEALDILRSMPVDVLMTDLGLPGIPGDVLARQAREVRPGIRIVFATGDGTAPKPEGGALLRKPYDTASIAHALQQLAEQR